jgi:bifunctional non-homologous end joining protein LigD
MSLDEYKRKRRFDDTPEPAGELDPHSRHRFVVQRHRASRLHYDFRLELDGVLKSWAVPRGPSLDPADKRLAMQVEDHPVSYFEFEGIIPEGNYGAGTLMVWEVGTWQPLNPVAVQGKYVPTTDEQARAMLAKGDFKFRLEGKRLRGDFALVKMRGRRPGSKGNEWLLIKKHDSHVEEGFDIDAIDESVLSGRSMAEIAGDTDSAEWRSRPAGRGKLKAAWLAAAVAKLDRKKKEQPTTGVKDEHGGGAKKHNATPPKGKTTKPSVTSVPSVVKASSVSTQPMPRAVHPMLSETAAEAFDDPAWLFEIKWDGYRAIAFIEERKIRLVSRNQVDLTAKYPELSAIPQHLRARTAVLDGEIVALDESGRASFSLLQQRSGFRLSGRKAKPHADVAVLYYAFDLIYLDGRDLRQLPLEQRKQQLASLIAEGGALRYSDHFAGRGIALLALAREKGLEGIVAKRRDSAYQERRSADWRKIKIRHTVECVIGGYTEPEGSRKHFGSIVLGLYDGRDRLVHVGQAGSGFDEKALAALAKIFQPLETRKKPFYGEVEALRKITWMKPELVAQIEFAEWTLGSEGSSPKLRAPVFLGLRDDKLPEDCGLKDGVVA